MPLEKENRPDYLSTDYKAMAPAWTMCRDAREGTLVIREKGEAYLPKNPKEKDTEYNRRKSRVEFIPAFEKTVSALTGMMFRKPMSFSDKIPPDIAEYLKNVDLLGNDLENFAKLLVLDAMTVGISHFLVEYPDMTGVKTLEQERAANARPYFVHIKPENLLSWRYEQTGGMIRLTQIVLREQKSEMVGAFGEKMQTQYRVITPTGWQVLQIVEASKDQEEKVEVVREGKSSIGVIPLATLNLNQTGFLTAKPLLLELAIQNISHYNVLADHRNSLHFSGLPLLVIEEDYSIMDKGGEIVISSDSAIRTKPGSRVYYAEHSGNALGQSRQELQDIEGRMAKSGLSMLAPNQAQDIRATKLRIEKTENDSKLSLATKEAQNCLNLGLEYMAKWINRKEVVTVSLNKDFNDEAMSTDMVGKLSEMVSKGQLSIETLWDSLVKGEILPDSFDKEVELGRINDNILGPTPTGGNGNENEEN